MSMIDAVLLPRLMAWVLQLPMAMIAVVALAKGNWRIGGTLALAAAALYAVAHPLAGRTNPQHRGPNTQLQSCHFYCGSKFALKNSACVRSS